MYTPFLELNLAPICTCLCGDELLEVAHGIVWAAFDAYWTGARQCGKHSGEMGKTMNLCVPTDR